MVEAENLYNRYGNIRTAFLKTRGRNIDVNEKGDEPRQELQLNGQIRKLHVRYVLHCIFRM